MANCLTLKKSNCKNCYKCIRHCPVKAIRFSGNQAHIIGNECILCGQCFVVCPQDAKEIVNEVEKVKVFLQSGEPVVVSIAPSFIANYDGAGINSMRTALKKLGFYDVEETAIGATIVKNEYERMLEEEDRDVVISSCCHSINLLIQKHYPAVLEYLADVMSPMQAHCQDIKKRIPNAKTVFVGPCVAKKDEAVKLYATAPKVVSGTAGEGEVNVLDALDLAAQKLYENDVKQSTKIVATVTPRFFTKFRKDYASKDTDNSAILKNGKVAMYGNLTIKMSNNVAKARTTTEGDTDLIQVKTQRAIAFAKPLTHTEAYRPEKGFADAVKGFILFDAKIVRPKEMFILNVKH